MVGTVVEVFVEPPIDGVRGGSAKNEGVDQAIAARARDVAVCEAVPDEIAGVVPQPKVGGTALRDARWCEPLRGGLR